MDKRDVKLALMRNTMIASQPCGVCGGRTETSRRPFAVCVAGTVKIRLRLLCRFAIPNFLSWWAF